MKIVFGEKTADKITNESMKIAAHSAGSCSICVKMEATRNDGKFIVKIHRKNTHCHTDERSNAIVNMPDCQSATGCDSKQ